LVLFPVPFSSFPLSSPPPPPPPLSPPSPPPPPFPSFFFFCPFTDVPIGVDKFLNLSEIKHNPFRYRFAKVFGEAPISSLVEPPQATKLTREQLLKSAQDVVDVVVPFDAFLKFLSACSYRSDLSTKTRLAFSLYDFDQDGSISTLDIECMLVLALGNTQLHTAQYKQIAHEVMSEVDIDGNGTLTELEFSGVLSRLHDFESRMTLDIEF